MRAGWFVFGVVAVLFAISASDRDAAPQQAATDLLPDSNLNLRTQGGTPFQQVEFPQVPLQYRGDACSSDCSGHEAGHEWAEREGIDDPDDCSGNSESFIEGCRAYAEEQKSTALDETEDTEE